MTKKKKCIIASVASAVALVLVAAIIIPIVIFTNRDKDNNENIDWNNLTIAGFENFTALGSAVFDTDGASVVADRNGLVASSVSDKQDKHDKKDDAHLVGFKKDGKCEKIKFEDEKGNKYEQDLKLIHFEAYEHFSFAMFTEKDDEYLDFDEYYYQFMYWENTEGYTTGIGAKDEHFEHYYSNEYHTFLIDNKTGKIYSFEDIVETVKETFKDDFYLEPVTVNEKRNSYDYDYILFKAHTFDNDKVAVYQLTFEKNKINITERINAVQFENFVYSITSSGGYLGSYPEIYCDRYGNITLNNSYWREQIGKVIYQTTDGTFGEISADMSRKNTILSPNGIFYYKEQSISDDPDKVYCLNQNGELELTSLGNTELFNLYRDFTESSYYRVSKFLYQKDNVIYLAYATPQDNPQKHGLMKMVLSEENDYDYTLEFVDYNENVGITYYGDGANKTLVAANDDYVYELRQNVLKKYDIETGASTLYESQYTFKGLKFNKKLNQVTFVAVDQSTMMEVGGYFDENNEIVIGDFKDVNRGLNRVYVIKSLN